MFIRCLLYMKHCVRHWRYNNGEEREFRATFMKLIAQEILNKHMITHLITVMKESTEYYNIVSPVKVGIILLLATRIIVISK